MEMAYRAFIVKSPGAEVAVIAFSCSTVNADKPCVAFSLVEQNDISHDTRKKDIVLVKLMASEVPRVGQLS